ncbi:MAG: transcription termination/antitermination NusG family protein [Blastocatellia bacterium]
MSQSKIQSENCWYVIHTHAKQEERATSNLKVLGLETFTPKFRKIRYNEFNGKPIISISQLFPGYIFARFEIADALHKVRFTRGVHSIVSISKSPCPVDECVISLIKARVAEDGFVRMYEELKPGDVVEICHGSLKGLSGVFQSHLKGSERVMILLDTISYQASVEIEREKLRKVADPFR